MFHHNRKKRGSSAVERKRTYSIDEKNMLVCWSQWNGFRNKNLDEKLEIFSEVGYSVPYGTFRDWQRKFMKYGSAELPHDERGRPPLLDRLERDIFEGMILARSEAGENLRQVDLAEFIRDEFGYVCSPQAAGEYARRSRFGIKDFQTGTTSGKFATDELIEKAYAWLAKKRLREADPAKVCCIDFTFTSHRKDIVRGYCRKGAPPPRKSTRPTRFTNLIICASFADGVDRAPPMMFTFDPAFDTSRSSTELREKAREKVAKTLNEVRKYGVRASDIRYVQPPVNKKRQSYVYVGERKELLEIFMKERAIDRKTFIFRDAGPVFGPKNSSVLKALGYENEIVFEPAVHQFLSTCDNGWFGPAKKMWRKKFRDFDDDIVTSIWLLAFLRKTYPGVQARFEKNLLLGVKRLKEEEVERLIVEQSEARRNEDIALKSVYRIFMRLDGRGDVEKRKADPHFGNLDGAYYLVKKPRKNNK